MVDVSPASDTAQFVAVLRSLSLPPQPSEPAEYAAARAIFRWDAGDILVSRAPGRLDVMGGIADYSGSLVLQLPIREACHVAVQRHPVDLQPCWPHVQQRHAAAGSPSPTIQVVSFHADPRHRDPTFDVDLDQLLPGGTPVPYEEANKFFKGTPNTSWAAYAVGVLLVLAHERGMQFQDGMSILISSDVPEGKGVSSSASLEVAVMIAVVAAYGLELDKRELALLCQMVENKVVGAPCGIMDQMSSSLGEAQHLLMLLCQPAEVLGQVPIPSHVAFWGIDSGVRHSVAGADYGSVRVGAFMGLRITSELEALTSRGDSNADTVGPIEPMRGGYLANINPSEFNRRFKQGLPETITGREFLERYHSHFDSMTSIDPNRTYAVRVATTHPVEESLRVRLFQKLLQAPQSAVQLELLGELMFQSHDSYSACGLGSDGTDRLVSLVQDHIAAARAAGQQPRLHGAKITGGGCGGTVCVLADAGPQGEEAVKKLAAAYAVATNHNPHLFEGSSMGAQAFHNLPLK